MNEEEIALTAAMNAVIHLQEFIDSGRELDRISATQSLSNPFLRDWVTKHEVLLPLRRDGKKVYAD